MHRLFISHRWRYDDYDRLVAMLNRVSGFYWRDFSVSERRGFEDCSWETMATALHDQIQPVHAVIVVAGMEANYSEWMQTEARIATEWFDKPLVWVRPEGVKRIPSFANDVADEVVCWSSRSIVAGIKRAIRNRRPDFAARLT